MTIQITAVHFGGLRKTHEAIERLRYLNLQTRQTQDVTKPALVA